MALVAGAASGFFGIGGGFLIVPGLMLSTGMPRIHAVGSSLLATRLATKRNLLNRIFAVLIIVVALYVLYQSRGAVALP